MVGIRSTLVASVLSLVLAVACYALYQKASRFEEELIRERGVTASYKAAVENSNKVILSLNEKIKTSQRASQELSEANTKLRKDFNEIDEKLKSHLGRLDKAFTEHPKLMESLTNKSFNDFLDKVACINGETKLCKGSSQR